MTDLETAIRSVRQPLSADGADLDIVGERDGTVTLQLVLDNVECIECILPKAHLETIILKQIQKYRPSIHSVVLEDPRCEAPQRVSTHPNEVTGMS
jgi:hypothetical protein